MAGSWFNRRFTGCVLETRMIFEGVSCIIADDHSRSRAIVEAILRSAGMRDIRHAEDGAIAREKLFLRKPDVMVLDFEMPTDGITTLQQIRRTNHFTMRRTPVVMLTAYTSRAKVEAMRDAGAHEILTKPFTGGQLLQRVHAALTAKRLFIESANYIGPCRRRRDDPTFPGPYRRVGDQSHEIFEIA